MIQTIPLIGFDIVVVMLNYTLETLVGPMILCFHYFVRFSGIFFESLESSFVGFCKLDFILITGYY